MTHTHTHTHTHSSIRGRRGHQRVRWHHRCNGHELGQTSGNGEGQGGLGTAHGVAKSRTRLGDWTTTVLSNIRRLVPLLLLRDVFPDHLLKNPSSFSSQYSLFPSLFYFSSLCGLPANMNAFNVLILLFSVLLTFQNVKAEIYLCALHCPLLQHPGHFLGPYQMNEWMINIALQLQAQANLNPNLGTGPY